MKVLQVYNQYRSLFNGEEKVVFDTVELLKQHGHEVELWMRSSRGIEQSLGEKAKAFFSGVYSFEARQAMQQRLTRNPVDVVHAHNLYPLFSPSVISACKRQQVPVLLSLHNQNLTCPKADHLRNGSICESCTGAGRELNCVLKNCRGSWVESVGYALRSAAARKLRMFHDNVTFFIALTEFAKRRLVANGFRESQIRVLPNTAPDVDEAVDPAAGQYIAFAGRLSEEKGITTLLKAGGIASETPLALAGSGPLDELVASSASDNVQRRGRLDQTQMRDFYRNARALVLPSTCFEMCPLVILEAMAHGLPVIASRIGGLGELVDDGETGLLFEPGNADELADKLKQLWSDPERCRQMGAAGRAKALREYSTATYLRRLTGLYREASALCGRPLVEEPLQIDASPQTEPLQAIHD